MYSGRPEVKRIGHVCLRVRDLESSIDFYHSVLRFRESHNASPDGRTRWMVTTADGDRETCEIELSEGRPVSSVSMIGHFSLEAATADAVDGIYFRARAAHARATEPADVGDRRQTFIFDPDGHKIQVFARLEIESDSVAAE